MSWLLVFLICSMAGTLAFEQCPGYTKIGEAFAGENFVPDLVDQFPVKQVKVFLSGKEIELGQHVPKNQYFASNGLFNEITIDWSQFDRTKNYTLIVFDYDYPTADNPRERSWAIQFTIFVTGKLGPNPHSKVLTALPNVTHASTWPWYGPRRILVLVIEESKGINYERIHPIGSELAGRAHFNLKTFINDFNPVMPIAGANYFITSFNGTLEKCPVVEPTTTKEPTHSGESSEEEPDEPRLQLHIIFALDSSKTTPAFDYEKIKTFLIEVIEYTEHCYTKTYGLIAYNSNAHMIIYPGQTPTESVKEQISYYTQSHIEKRSTETALNGALVMFKQVEEKYEGNKRLILVLVQGGETENVRKMVVASKALIEFGVDIYMVGLGDDVFEEFDKTNSDYRYIFMVNNGTQLLSGDKLLKKLVGRICKI